MDMVLETKCRGKKERNEPKTPRINNVRSKKIIQHIRSTMTKQQERPIQENLRTETTHPQEVENRENPKFSKQEKRQHLTDKEKGQIPI